MSHEDEALPEGAGEAALVGIWDILLLIVFAGFLLYWFFRKPTQEKAVKGFVKYVLCKIMCLRLIQIFCFCRFRDVRGHTQIH